MDLSEKEPNNILKTLIDYSVSAVCLLLMIPVILILIILIRITGNGPVIFTQKRIGKSGKPFFMYKFRSMHHGTEDGIPLLSGKNDNRITSLGRFMRKHKLDEIPNLINVLKGEMTLVGPRPEQPYFVEQIIQKAPDYKMIQALKPGITSWGQVKYGYATDVDQMVERLKYDLFYIEKRSLWFDFKIAVYTLGIVIKGEGV
jgi:lipopolysaccharide/colanic/teichoic acid biosynthesis glycosyltransferase